MVKKLLSVFVTIVSLTGCSHELSNASADAQKEYILTQLNDYQGLIEISRKKLSAKDNNDERFNLSQLYHKIGDYSSSNIYLEPLVKKRGDEKYRLLQAKNYLELGQEEECEMVLKELLANDSTNGELWNLNGSLLAQQGRYSEAIKSFEHARGLFYNESIVINNLAMMAILQQDYPSARNYLLSLYSRKQYKPQTVYNLVYTLVKLNDYESARKIINDERLYSGDVNELLYSLANLTPKKKFNLETKSVVSTKKDETKLTENIVTPKSTIVTAAISSKSNALTENPGVKTESSDICAIEMSTQLKAVKFIGNIKNGKEIKKISFSPEPSAGRFTLYSSYPVNYIVHPQKYNNQIELELFNAQPIKSVYQTQLSILQNNPDIKLIDFTNKNDGNVLLRIVTGKCIASKKIERKSSNGNLKEQINISFAYKD
ncbi:hypothetical protein [Enterobacter sp.]|uniref:tetratricopeptide repeat protein n=1 Tax=Enterobacter sp. TaxID=42895 RepID=UPI00296F7C55|nr:hypothetical protein [Enterobacter sp.]